MRHPVNTVLGWRIPDRLLTWGPAAFVGLEGIAAILVRHNTPARGNTLLAGLAGLVGLLVLRHRAPLRVLGAVLLLSLLIGYGPLVMLPVLLALFTVAEYCERPQVAVAGAVTGAVVLLTTALHGPGLETLSQVLSRLVAVGLAIALGLYLRTRAEYVVGLQERAARLEREQQLLAEQAVAEERLRIARELHDVVAHNVSLIVVQAQAMAAGEVSESTAGQLATIAGLGRSTMGEMHRMLGVLRPPPAQDDATPELAPQPGIAELPELIARARAAGLEAELAVSSLPAELPPAVGLSVYRIVQEAITNVVRHARAERVRVEIRASAGSLEVAIEDDGTGEGAPSEPGHGIIGMRERTHLFGGSLRTGRRTDGPGYAVRASLPLR